MDPCPRPRFLSLFCFLVFLIASASALGQGPAISSTMQLSQVISALREKSKTLESSSCMRRDLQLFSAAHNLPSESIRYSDFVFVRLRFEIPRVAGLWNM